MDYGREFRFGGGARFGRGPGRGRRGYGREYGFGPEHQGRFRGYGRGFTGGALRSRGSYEAGQLRSGLNERDEFEFEWGEGYVGGRGYGGTNYDLEHGYRTGARRPTLLEGQRQRPTGPSEQTSPATRGGYAWADRNREDVWPERERSYAEPHGPARYGYGPYYDRLQRRRRDDDEIRQEVEDALFYDTWVDADRVDVSVEDGIVTLRGTLPDYEEVRYATDDAWDIDGVRGVRTELQVEGESTSDRLQRRDEFQPEAIARENERQTGGAAEAKGARAEGGAAAQAKGRGGGKKGGSKKPTASRARGGRAQGKQAEEEAAGGETTGEAATAD